MRFPDAFFMLWMVLSSLGAAVLLVVVYDLVQTRQAILDERFGARSLRKVFNHDPRWGQPKSAAPSGAV